MPFIIYVYDKLDKVKMKNMFSYEFSFEPMNSKAQFLETSNIISYDYILNTLPNNCTP